MIRDADLRKEMISQLSLLHKLSETNLKKYTSLGVLVGFCFAILLFLPAYNISVHKVLGVPLVIEESGKMFLGVLMLGLFARAFYLMHVASLFDHQIKMLKIVNLVDEKIGVVD